MVIYTLPGPIYNYSVSLPDFEPDTLDFDAKVNPQSRTNGNSTPVQGTATVLLNVKSIRGLSNVSLSITPSDSDLGTAVIAPDNERLSGAVVADSYVVTAAYLERGEYASIALSYQRRSTGAADVTFMLTANELRSPVCTRMMI